MAWQRVGVKFGLMFVYGKLLMVILEVLGRARQIQIVTLVFTEAGCCFSVNTFLRFISGHDSYQTVRFFRCNLQESLLDLPNRIHLYGNMYLKTTF